MEMPLLLLQQRRLFYTYQVAEGDTPELIADKYYGSVKYHWVISLLNNITDPLLDWPKNYANLVAYIVEKYGSIAAASTQIVQYSMTQTKEDSFGNTSEQTYIIDLEKYNTLTSLVPVVYTFGGGGTVTVTTTRASLDAYTYEVALNESKRTIKLLKSDYLPQVVGELEQLLAV